ncbi:MAG: tRNA (adenosine(37)-N6)-threonylcarbamoyltransferase complex transferase subunit TsaD, partial [Bacillota bacterium]|nr:tRNA (adenosine(37)-N6)-threonylcarbamoyltransferase complex transferase subunit TsaD [Bacillota bacterium]
LAIETSCDETSAAVVEDGRKVLSNTVLSQIDMHADYGGVVPEIASRQHVEAIVRVADECLKESGVKKTEIDAVAASAAPGLIGALLVGVNFGKSLAYALDKPFIPVHHVRGHIAANYLTYPELKPPFLCLTVSGGHTMIVEVRDYTDLRVVGATRDDAAGEAFDKTARVLGLGYPGGAKIDRLSKGGDENGYRFPRASVEGAPFDFSFSGLKTAALNLIHRSEQKNERIDLNSFAASFSKAVSDELVPRFFDAAETLKYKTLAVCGGVSANSRLRGDLTARAASSGARLFLPELKYCSDNAAMIGSQAFYEYAAGNLGPLGQNAEATRDIEASFYCGESKGAFPT